MTDESGLNNNNNNNDNDKNYFDNDINNAAVMISPMLVVIRSYLKTGTLLCNRVQQQCCTKLLYCTALIVFSTQHSQRFAERLRALYHYVTTLYTQYSIRNATI